MNTNTEKSTAKALFSVLKPYIIAVIVGFMISWVFKLIFSPTIVSGSSMYPTYESGDIVKVNKEFTPSDITYGTVVVFDLGKKKDYFKRVVALPGDSLYIDDKGFLIVNDLKSEYQFGYCNDAGCLSEEITLKDNEYFCMGDNRNASMDCREFGPIDYSCIKSVVVKKIF